MAYQIPTIVNMELLQQQLNAAFAGTPTIAGKPTFTGLPALSFANDGAAAAGGVAIGGLYHTAGAVKVRLV